MPADCTQQRVEATTAAHDKSRLHGNQFEVASVNASEVQQRLTELAASLPFLHNSGRNLTWTLPFLLRTANSYDRMLRLLSDLWCAHCSLSLRACPLANARGHDVVTLNTVPASGTGLVQSIYEAVSGVRTESIYREAGAVKLTSYGSYHLNRSGIGHQRHGDTPALVKAHLPGWGCPHGPASSRIAIAPMPHASLGRCVVSRAIVLFRNPLDSAMAMLHYLYGESPHRRPSPNDFFSNPLHPLGVGKLGRTLGKAWRILAPRAVRYNVRWHYLAARAYAHIPTLIVHYEALVANQRSREAEAARILQFVGVNGASKRAPKFLVGGSHSATLPLQSSNGAKVRHAFATTPGVPSYVLATNFFDKSALPDMTAALDDEVALIAAEAAAGGPTRDRPAAGHICNASVPGTRLNVSLGSTVPGSNYASACIDEADTSRPGWWLKLKIPETFVVESALPLASCGGQWLCVHFPK